MKKSILIIGGGGHAKVLISVIRKLKIFRIVGYTDLIPRGEILGVKYLGDDSILKKVKQGDIANCAALGIGKTEKQNCRKKILSNLKKLKFEIPPIISPDATVNEDVLIGNATVVFDGVVVNSGSQIGEAAILNTNSTVEHDCSIGNYSHIAPGVTLSGGVYVGNDSFIGAGSTVINGKKIADNCVIGAGSVVIRDCSSSGTYVGNPSRRVK